MNQPQPLPSPPPGQADASLRILFVEDNPADRVLLSETLGADSNVTVDAAERLSDALSALTKRDYDLILLDLSLPDSAGLGTFQSVYAQARERPIIILSGNRDETTAVEAVRLGAQDYLIKGCIDPDQLLKTFRYAIERSNTRRELLSSRARYRRLYENVLAGVYQMELDGTLLSANPEMLRLLGFDTEDVLLSRNMRTSIFVSADEFDEHVDALLNEGGRLSSEIQVRRSSGEQRVLLDSSTLVRERNGCIRFIEGTLIDITERKRAERKLEFLAQYDKLTGLANRYLFRTEAARCLSNAKRSGSRGAILLLDLDRFKEVNDTLGHETGDKLLQHVAGRMRGALRSGDLVARLGGDEFAVLLHTIGDPAAIARVSEKLLSEVGQPLELSGRMLTVTPSIGIATFPDAGDDLDSVLRAADVAMYRAKDAGRNAFEFYTERMHEAVVAGRAFETELREAVEADRLELEFQPGISVQTGRIVGLEARLRWDSASRGTVEPAEFVPCLESTGLIVEVGRRTLRRATRALARWRQQRPGDNLYVSVDVSERQLADPDRFAEDVRSALDESGVPAPSLELEIAESALLSAPQHCAEALTRIQALGVRVAVDDFGLGFASLRELRRLPVGRIKIARSLVSAAARDGDDRAVVEACANLARRLGLSVTFAGVETAASLECLDWAAGDVAQGDHVGRPMSDESVTRLFQSSA